MILGNYLASAVMLGMSSGAVEDDPKDGVVVRLSQAGRGPAEARAIVSDVLSGRKDVDAVVNEIVKGLADGKVLSTEEARVAAASVLCQATTLKEDGTRTLSNPSQLDALLSLSRDSSRMVRINVFGALAYVEDSTAAFQSILQRCYEAAGADECASARENALRSLLQLVDHDGADSWQRWRGRINAFASNPGEQFSADYETVRMSDELRYDRDWEVEFRAAALSCIARHEGCRAVVALMPEYDGRGRVAAVGGMARAIQVDMLGGSRAQAPEDLIAFGGILEDAVGWKDVPSLPLPSADAGSSRNVDPASEEEAAPPVLQPLERAVVLGVNALTTAVASGLYSDVVAEAARNVLRSAGSLSCQDVVAAVEAVKIVVK